MEKIKLKIELLAKRIEILKSKLLLFSAGVAGCWAYISANYTKAADFLLILSLVLVFMFGVGVTVNLFKFSAIINKIEELERGLNE